MRFLVVLALVFAACGDDDSGDGTPLTIGELPQAYRRAACGHFVACGLFPDRTACLAANLPAVSDRISFYFDPNVITALEEGRAQLDLPRVNACLAAIASLTCDTTDRDERMLLQECRGLVLGTRAAGEPCFTREECISQQCSGGYGPSTCDLGACMGDTPPSLLPSRLGKPCFTQDCEEGAYCDETSTATCVALRSAGEPCTSVDECGYGLGCAGDPGARICKPLPGLDEPCPDGMCRDLGMYCGASGTCERVGVEGAACTGGPAACAPAYPCDPSSRTCTRSPGVGETCALSAVPCFDAGLVCDGASRTCIAPKENGEPCTISAVCKSGNCGYPSGVCEDAMICR